MKNLRCALLLPAIAVLTFVSSCSRMSDDQVFRAVKLTSQAAYLAKEVIVEK